MRTIKLAMVLLLSVLVLTTLGHRLFQSFTVTGQANTLSAPTNVTASDNSYSTKVGVSWDTVRGATLYRIFRNAVNDTASASVVGTTAEGTFFDPSGAAGQAFFYWVRAENGNVVSSLSAPDQGTRANGIINGPVPPLNPPPAPLGNPVTATKAYLGKTLFWDEQLSSTRTVACGTCHFAANGGSDARAIVNSARSRNAGADGVFGTADDVFASPGVISNNSDGTFSWSPLYGFREQVTGRKSRSYIDAGYSNTLFWDGRATSTFTDPIGGGVVLQNGAALESQVAGPPVSSAEMAHAGRTWNDVAVRVTVARPLTLSPSVPAGLKEWIGSRSYSELFEEAFGTPEVTPARIAMAIATFERTVYSDRTPFDETASGIGQLPPEQVRGQGVFNQSRCNVCHAGTLFSDNAFHNIGVRPQTEDTGRFQVTGNANNIGEFRTPSLRNVGLRSNFFHDGKLATLDEVVDFYNRGGDFNAPNIDHNLIRPLGLSPQQKSDLLAFLRGALTDPRVAAGTSPFDRPTLYSESTRVPQVTGAGTQGSGGNIPQVTANEPPLAGNPSFAVGVSNALGGATAVLVIDSNDPGTGPAIPATASFARLSLQLSGSGAGQGFGSASLLIPANPALIGSSFFGRWYVQDANAAGGVAVTPLFKFTVFVD
jgi:cytochrome c peroxidase